MMLLVGVGRMSDVALEVWCYPEKYFEQAFRETSKMTMLTLLLCSAPQQRALKISVSFSEAYH
jgi:hypothetical protein